MRKENGHGQVLVWEYDMSKVLRFTEVKPADNFSEQSSGLKVITTYYFNSKNSKSILLPFTSVSNLVYFMSSESGPSISSHLYNA